MELSETLVKCLESNHDMAVWTHNQIIEGMQGEIDRLQETLQFYRERDARMSERIGWLLGNGPGEFFIDRR